MCIIGVFFSKARLKLFLHTKIALAVMAKTNFPYINSQKYFGFGDFFLYVKLFLYGHELSGGRLIFFGDLIIKIHRIFME